MLNAEKCNQCKNHTFIKSDNPKIESMCFKCGFKWSDILKKLSKYTDRDKIMFNLKGK